MIEFLKTHRPLTTLVAAVTALVISISLSDQTVQLQNLSGLKYPAIPAARLAPWALACVLGMAIHCPPLKQLRHSARPIRLYARLHWLFLCVLGGVASSGFQPQNLSVIWREWFMAFGLATVCAVLAHRSLPVLGPALWGLMVLTAGINSDTGTPAWWNITYRSPGDAGAWALACTSILVAAIIMSVKPFASART